MARVYPDGDRWEGLEGGKPGSIAERRQDEWGSPGGGGGAGIDGPGGPGEAGSVATSTATSGAAASDRAAELAAAVDAGTMTPEQAMSQLIDDAVADLPPDEAAELRALMTDFLGEDPYLTGLLR